MPPKKKNKEEKSSAAATTPTPGSATNPESAEDRQNELTANFDSIVDDFTSSSTVAIETFQEILNQSLEISKSKFIQENTDLYTANAACEALTELTDWLYLKCEEPAELNDFEEIQEPEKCELDAWAENAVINEDKQFGLDKVDEVVDMHKGQRGLVFTVDRTQISLLPDWLRPESRVPSTAAPSMYSQTLMTPKNKPRRKPNGKVNLKKNTSSSNILKIDENTKSKKSETSEKQQKPKIPDSSNSSSVSAGRMRQFKRRSNQHKIQKKINQGPNNRLEPMGEYGIPAKFVDPADQEREDRRKGFKDGSIKNKTNLNQKVRKIPSLRSHSELPAVKSSITRITALPETLVDSLAISNGSSLSNSMLEHLEVADFDKLPPVSIKTSP